MSASATSATAAIARKQWLACFARALFAQSAITVEGETARYPSSDLLDRVFCKKCGTRLFAWRKVGGTAGIALAAFDDCNALTPTAHIWMLKR